MRILVAVDHSQYSEIALARLLAQDFAAGSAICLLMVINPFIPPPIATVFDVSASLDWRIRFRAIRRVEELALLLRFAGGAVETNIVETRLPEGIVLLIQALKWKADFFLAGIHSFCGIRRYFLESFVAVIAKRKIPPCGNTTPDSTNQYNQAA